MKAAAQRAHARPPAAVDRQGGHYVRRKNSCRRRADSAETCSRGARSRPACGEDVPRRLRGQGAGREDRLVLVQLPARDSRDVRTACSLSRKPGGRHLGEGRQPALAGVRRRRAGFFQRPVRLCAHQPSLCQCCRVSQRRARHAASRLRAGRHEHLRDDDAVVRGPRLLPGHPDGVHRYSVQRRLRC